MKKVCWICERETKSFWHFHADLNGKYFLCWFCAGVCNDLFCSFEHEKCKFWVDYTCTRVVKWNEMERLRNVIRRKGLGGMKFVKKSKSKPLNSYK